MPNQPKFLKVIKISRKLRKSRNVFYYLSRSRESYQRLSKKNDRTLNQLFWSSPKEPEIFWIPQTFEEQFF